MSTRRSQLTREAARLFAEKGYHGTSMGDLAEAMGVHKGSLYAHISSKQDLLYDTMREGGRALACDVPEQIGLRVDVGVQRPLPDAERLGEVADRGAVVALFREQPRRLAG